MSRTVSSWDNITRSVIGIHCYDTHYWQPGWHPVRGRTGGIKLWIPKHFMRINKYHNITAIHNIKLLVLSIFCLKKVFGGNKRSSYKNMTQGPLKSACYMHSLTCHAPPPTHTHVHTYTHTIFCQWMKSYQSIARVVGSMTNEWMYIASIPIFKGPWDAF